VAIAKRAVNLVACCEVTDKGKIDWGDVVKEETLKGSIVVEPNPIPVRVTELVTTLQGAIEPACETLAFSDQLGFVAPLLPIRFCDIQDEIFFPGRG
jgi:hypothetical protein